MRLREKLFSHFYVGDFHFSQNLIFRLPPRRELELKMIKTGVLCTELVGGWGRKIFRYLYSNDHYLV